MKTDFFLKNLLKNVQRSLLTAAAFFCLLLSSGAQPFTEALRINPAQRDYAWFQLNDIARRSFLQKNTLSDTLPIPFFDDFSRPDLSWAPSRFWFGYAIHDIHFLSSSEARAFGDAGINLRSGNRGSTWQKNGPETGKDFRSVSFPAAGLAWACGSRGWLAFSEDSGKTWTAVNSPAGAGMRLDKIAFFSAQTGLLIDSAGTMYRTENGGQSWSNPLLTSGSGFRARAIAFVNGNRVVAAGDSARTAVSDDGGQSFSVSSQPFGRHRHFRNLHFADGFFGLAIGDSGMVFKTTSSGSSWSLLPLICNETLHDAAINPANKKLCWMVGTAGALFYSQNGGSSWSKIRSGTTEDLLSIALVNEFRGWIGSNGGRLHQVIYDPLRPYSRLWETGSGVYVNNTFSSRQPTYGIATLDGLNDKGIPYSLIKNKTGPCDTLCSAAIDLQDFQGSSLFLSFYYQPGSDYIELIPDPEDSLALQFKGKGGNWVSVWNIKGKGDTVLSNPFRYASVRIPDSLKFRGSRFRFVNFGNQNGNYDIWNLDYIRLDTEHDGSDSLARDYSLSLAPGRLLRSYSALPLEQFQYAIDRNLPIFNDRISWMGTNLNTGAANLNGSFFLNRLVPDSVQAIGSLPASAISGLENPFGFGIFSRPLSVEVSAFQSLLRTSRYATFEYGIGLSPDPAANLYTGNDSLSSRLNVSTVMAYDDGSAELVRGVGQNGSIAVQKYYLPVADTLTDVQLFFARTPENLQQTISFALLVYDSLNIETNFAADPPLIRRQFILPPADSVNKFITFSLRDDETLGKRILQGGRSFYVGWQQGLIDNGNEVRIGCDINSLSPSSFFYKTGGEWKAWTADSLTLMIRPVFGPEYVTAVKDRIRQPEFPFFPNPASDGFRNRRDFSDLRICDLTGKPVYEQRQGTAGEIIRPGLPSGMYIMHWLEEGRRPVVQKMRIDQ